MDARLKIDITEEDIKKAHRNDSYTCMVSQAIARLVPDARRIETDTQTIRFTRGTDRFIYVTPYAAQLYVIAFDAGATIEPFSFDLRGARLIKRKLLTETGKEKMKAYQHAYRINTLPST